MIKQRLRKSCFINNMNRLRVILTNMGVYTRLVISVAVRRIGPTPAGKQQELVTTLVSPGEIARDMDIYLKYDLHANSVTVYFTPSAKPLAEVFKARKHSVPLFGKEGLGEILLNKSPSIPLFQRGR